MYQPLIKFHPHPAIITQVLRIFVCDWIRFSDFIGERQPDARKKKEL